MNTTKGHTVNVETPVNVDKTPSADRTTFTILVIDQFATPFPSVQLATTSFDQFVADVLAAFAEREKAQPNRRWFSTERPRLLEVDDGYRPEMATTTFRADADGNVKLWRCNWDSSG